MSIDCILPLCYVDEPEAFEDLIWRPSRTFVRRKKVLNLDNDADHDTSGQSSTSSTGSDSDNDSQDSEDSDFDFGDIAITKRVCSSYETGIKGSQSKVPLANNFYSNAQWSPDGGNLLTISEDKRVRIWAVHREGNSVLPHPKCPAILMNAPVYACEWFPLMLPLNTNLASETVAHSTRFFLASSQSNPVTLWHADTGNILGYMYANNPTDGDIPPTCLSACFTPDGAAAICGYENIIRVFDVRRATEGGDVALASTLRAETVASYVGADLLQPNSMLNLANAQGCMLSGIPPLPDIYFPTTNVAESAYINDETGARGRPILEIDVREAELFPPKGAPMHGRRRSKLSSGSSMFSLRLPYSPQQPFLEREYRIADAVSQWFQRQEQEYGAIEEDEADSTNLDSSLTEDTLVGSAIVESRHESGSSFSEIGELDAEMDEDYTMSDACSSFNEEPTLVRTRKRWYFGDLNVSRNPPEYQAVLSSDGFIQMSTPRYLRHWPLLEEVMAIREAVAYREQNPSILTDLNQDSTVAGICKGDIPYRPNATKLLEAIMTPHSIAGTSHVLSFGDPFSKRRDARKRRPNSTTSQRMRGIVSALDVCPYGTFWGGALAAGSYGGSIGIFDLRGGGRVGAILKPKSRNQGEAGVTQVKWSRPDGAYLFSGYRKHSNIDVWDIRSPQNPVLSLEREVRDSHHHKFEQDPSGRWLLTGSSKERVDLFDLHDIFRKNYERSVGSNSNENIDEIKHADKKGDSSNDVDKGRGIASALAALQRKRDELSVFASEDCNSLTSISVNASKDKEAFPPTQSIPITAIVTEGTNHETTPVAPALAIRLRPKNLDDGELPQIAIALGRRQLFVERSLNYEVQNKKTSCKTVESLELEQDEDEEKEQNVTKPLRSSIVICSVKLPKE